MRGAGPSLHVHFTEIFKRQYYAVLVQVVAHEYSSTQKLKSFQKERYDADFSHTKYEFFRAANELNRIMNVTFTFLHKYRKNLPKKYWRKLIMPSGINALKSVLRTVKKRLPNRDKKVSVLFYDPFTEEIDWPPDDKLVLK